MTKTVPDDAVEVRVHYEYKTVHEGFVRFWVPKEANVRQVRRAVDEYLRTAVNDDGLDGVDARVPEDALEVKVDDLTSASPGHALFPDWGDGDAFK